MTNLLRVLAAFAFALAGVVVPAAAPSVQAATPDLTVRTDATYVVQPEEGRVRIVVDIDATNRLKDTRTHRYYFDRAFLAVLPGTTNFSITSEDGDPSVRVTAEEDSHTLLQISFGERLDAGRTMAFRLRFDLPDPGGAATRQIRIGTSLVSFPVWAFASQDTPGSTVRVIFPPDFNVQQEAGEFPEPTRDGEDRIVFRTGELDAPLEFFAYFSADRPGAYTDAATSAQVEGRTARLRIRAWPDDPDWAERVGGLFTEGLPVIGELTGLPWTRNEPLIVQEAVSRSTGGYAGLFDPRAGRVEVAYYAGPFVVLHEAAHAWFNGGLLADRWANEAFASYYALEAAERLEQDATGQELTDELLKARVPLNAWGAVGREETATEDYGYAASLELARLVAERAGEDGLRAVWRAAAAREGAYQLPDADEPELVDGAPDWRGLLDLLEEKTGESYVDLWRQWVVRPAEARLLDERAAARAEYAAVTRIAGDWTLPVTVRESLRSWQYEQAMALLGDARVALERRAEVERAASVVGLEPSSTMELLFEGERGLTTVGSQADAELQTIEALVASAATRPAAPDLLQTLGLYDADPEGALAEAHQAYGRGDLVGAMANAAAAHDMWTGASELGRNRLLFGIGIALLVGLALAYALAFARRIRRARRGGGRALATAQAIVAASEASGPAAATVEPPRRIPPAGPGAYGTLRGDSPDPDG